MSSQIPWGVCVDLGELSNATEYIRLHPGCQCQKKTVCPKSGSSELTAGIKGAQVGREGVGGIVRSVRAFPSSVLTILGPVFEYQ